MALAGDVIVTGSLNLLRSTIESKVVVTLDGAVAVGVPGTPSSELGVPTFFPPYAPT
jgi:hypothetical protein